ncbi:hypothetical protein Agub_g9875 [Astrephomene gubernaculifera]|uniref:Uncharacterized protein n=1 Tax=Astrephomene gubernaculifera TaxID=47775 RepID=A0AAD3DWM4_9CHLO|nr:hypothetical protein Agub_g9875 [Astrephomene gubernaculifera]
MGKCGSTGQTPSQDAVVGALTNLVEAIAGLALQACDQQREIAELKQDISELKEQMSERKQEVAELRQEVAELKRDTSELKQDTSELKLQMSELKEQMSELKGGAGKLLMRQMATQTVNKLGRLVEPKMSAHEARDLCMALVKVLAEKKGSKVYKETVTKYPLLKTGVNTLCYLAWPVAHPMPEPAVTEEQLLEAIKQHVSPHMQWVAEEVLACLVDLAVQLKEPLFVSTAKPGADGEAVCKEAVCRS